MPVQIRRWLEVQGFERNPFEYYEADREELLASYFVEPEWFEALRGDPRQPASAVLFAPRGYGKTSQRLQIARLCGLEAQPPALVVQITDYKWLPADLTTLTARDYLRYVADQACRQLWEHCQRNPEFHRRFHEQPHALLRLHALRYWAAPPSYRLRLPEPALGPETVAELARTFRLPAAGGDAHALVEQFARHYEGLSDSDLQSELLELARIGGFVSLYILLDRTDEDQWTVHNPAMVLARLQPLISDLPVLEHPGYAFKFFLPDALQSLFAERRVGRVGERPPSYLLRWRDHDLLAMLARRLQAYSQPAGRVTRAARVNRFQDLCESGSNADERLVQAAAGSPRRMIQLARELVEQHCTQIDNPEARIPRTLLNRVIPLPVPLLSLDAEGFVCFDGQRAETVQLTEMERKVLTELWRQRGKLISKRDLTNAIYGKSEPNDIEALEKTIKRLRPKLAPPRNLTEEQCKYIDYVRQSGYRLVNYDPDQ
ncbi:MAG: winged helix-turn-helix domain-containing protein [Oscillochloridaceae bacterium]|nr:winged helix-turn-helix domain-containing protein [Chloroflexaceae bacterium]MDW8388898.1 winged helix-turn-helix domain-containing protein [Oscillochloridaceae bacterium]